MGDLYILCIFFFGGGGREKGDWTEDLEKKGEGQAKQVTFLKTTHWLGVISTI